MLMWLLRCVSYKEKFGSIYRLFETKVLKGMILKTENNNLYNFLSINR